MEVAEPEILVIKYRSSLWSAIFISAHAPNDTATDAVKQAFWHRLQAKLAVWVSHPVFLCVDANARLGTHLSGAVGSFSPEEENDNGFRFHQLLQSNRLCVPSTFEECIYDMDDEQGAWLAKNGWKRIDYIALPTQFMDGHIKTWTHVIEKDVLQEDHRAASLSLRATLNTHPVRRAHQHPSILVDRIAMQSEEGKKACTNLLEYFCDQQPPWEASADAHANFLNEAAVQCLPRKFPVQHRHAKPSWIQADTWDTITTTRQLRRQLRQLRKSWVHGMLRQVFHAWVSGTPTGESFRPWLQLHDFATARAIHRLERTRLARIQSLRRDEAAYISQCAQIQHDELTEAKGTYLWRKLKRDLPSFRKKIKKHLPFSVAMEGMHSHFATIEDARFRSIEAMCLDSRSKSQCALRKAAARYVEGCHLPTIFELEAAIRSSSCGKASVGCIPLEFLKANPPKAAELLMPMMTMFFRFQQQPLSWKGGAYFPLYKGKGSPQDPSSFRAILIGNVIPKLYHKIVRQRLMKAVEPKLLPFQIGGVPKMTVSYAAHFLLSLRQHAEHFKRSTAIIFFDLKSAFYRAQRSTVVGDKLGYGEDCLDEDVAVSTLGKEAALDTLEVPHNLQATIQELFSGTWNSVKVPCPHDQPLMQSTRGTRPGDPVADLTFTCVMQTILTQFLNEAQILLPTFPGPDGDIAVPPITWVDDIAIFVESEQAEQIPVLIEKVVQLMFKHCRAYGLDLNFAPGKTEALLRLHGRNSTQLRKTLFQEKFIQIEGSPGDKIALSAASHYTHLGIKHTATMNFDTELAYRMARAREALRECRKKILANKVIDPSTRWNLARSLVLSRLLFACELWPPLTTRQQSSIQAFFLKIGRIILDKQNFADTTYTVDDEVLAVLPIPHISTVVKVARLRYLSRLMRFAPAILVTLLKRMEFADSEAWVTRVRGDVRWMQQRVQRLQHLPDPLVDWDAWTPYYMAGRDWALAAISAFNADTTYRHSQARYRIWRRDFQSEMQQLGLAFQEEEPVPQCKAWKCTDCGASFNDKKARSVHMYKVHHQHAEVRAYMDSTVCGACLKDFHNIQKLRQHLQHKPDQCLRTLQRLWYPFDAAVLKDFKPSMAVKHAHRLPALQCYGPLLPPREVWQHAKPEKQFPDLPLPLEDSTVSEVAGEGEPSRHEDAQQQDMPDANLVADLIEYALRASTPFEPPAWDLLSAEAFQALVTFGDHLQDDLCSQLDPQVHMDIYWWLEGLLAQHFQQQRNPSMPCQPMTHPRQGRVAPVQPEERELWHQDRSRKVIGIPTPLLREPGPAQRQRYVLYAYSGHRREGDVVEWTRYFNEKFDYNVVMVTVDVVYEADLCDLRKETSKCLWLKAIRDGRFIAIIGAPPCETWSAARLRAILFGDGGPPPLHSVEQPWGLETNTWRQQKQILVANDLLQIWLRMMVAATITATAFIMEHPAPSRYIEDAPSVWKLAETYWLSLIPSAKRHLVYQGFFGAKSAKPTVFFVSHLDHFEETLGRWKDPMVNPAKWIQLVGKDQDGAWQTAQAKAYPSLLNAALVEAIFLKAQSNFEVRVEPDSSFLQAVHLVQLAQETSGKEMGADFAR